MAGFPTRVPAALGAYLAPAAGLQATNGWAAASLDAPAADRSISAEFVMACGASERAVNLQGFVAKVAPHHSKQGLSQKMMLCLNMLTSSIMLPTKGIPFHKGRQSSIMHVQVLAEAAAPLSAATVAERYIIVWQTQQPAQALLRQMGRSHCSNKQVLWRAHDKGGHRIPLQRRAGRMSLNHPAGTSDLPQVDGTPARAINGEPFELTPTGGCKGIIPPVNPARSVLRSVAWLQAAVRALPQGAVVQLRTTGALSFPAAAEAPGAILRTKSFWREP